MRVAVIGAGKMGLPLACQFASQGAEVMACDANPEVVSAIRAGRMLFDEPGVGELLSAARAAGRIDATTDITEGVRGRDVVVVIVPVALTAERNADFSIIEPVSAQIAAGLAPGTMVCYETTVPVGTTRGVLQPVLERSGLRAGADFDLVFSPERVKSQLVLKHLTQAPKIVGGITPESGARAAEFYSRYLGAPTINLGTLEASEFAKLAGMIYRDVNIALANELASYAEAVGLDFARIRDAANTDGEAYLLSPGIGVGGHCTPVYPYFVLRDAAKQGLNLHLTEHGRALNDAQAERLLDRVAPHVSLSGARVLILGLGFRPRIKEHTYSSAFLIRDAAEARGATVTLHDPLYSQAEIAGHGFSPASLDSDPPADLVVLNTAHPEYDSVDFADWARRGVKAVIDGRNRWDREKVRRAGLLYIAPGVV
jgi:nucleotide sugar dehydrogenase